MPKNPPQIGCRLRAGAGAAGHQPSAPGEGGEALRPAIAADAVDDDIDAALGGEAPHFRREILFAFVDAMFCAESFGLGKFLSVVRGDDGMGAEAQCQLQRRRRDTAADAANQYRLSGFEFGVGHQHAPSR